MRYQIPCGVHEDWPCCGCNTEVLTGEDAREAHEADQDLLYLQYENDYETADLLDELDAERYYSDPGVDYDDMQDFEDRYCPEPDYPF